MYYIYAYCYRTRKFDDIIASSTATQNSQLASSSYWLINSDGRLHDILRANVAYALFQRDHNKFIRIFIIFFCVCSMLLVWLFFFNAHRYQTSERENPFFFAFFRFLFTFLVRNYLLSLSTFSFDHYPLVSPPTHAPSHPFPLPPGISRYKQRICADENQQQISFQASQSFIIICSMREHRSFIHFCLMKMICIVQKQRKRTPCFMVQCDFHSHRNSPWNEFSTWHIWIVELIST